MNKSYRVFISRAAEHIKNQMVFVFLLLILLIAAFISPYFLQVKNIFNILRQASALGILATGQTIVIIAGGIDLSVAAVMQLAGVSLAEITGGQETMVWLAIPTVLLMGLSIGFLNGVLIAKRKVQPFISTLFVGLLITGIRFLVTRGTPSGLLPESIRIIGNGAVGIIPNALLTFLGLAAV
ncbi:MAG: ABC transporter permease, partial [Spirochaetota bacterium]